MINIQGKSGRGERKKEGKTHYNRFRNDTTVAVFGSLSIDAYPWGKR
jgi:hypothetical protein